ncbi:histone deacetylase complex protein [Cristinia sonorae]|uniref:histone deacetylase n=1 Tax=Cristinia sonorae TaxID=1940300 RepID=A0A8K0UE31_9AGAR|nr:histone deacetylase complex protein [Cristinia sonorae]
MEVDSAVHSDAPTLHTGGPTTTAVKRRRYGTPDEKGFRRFDMGYVYDTRMMHHSPRSEHTEAPERIQKIFEVLDNCLCTSQMLRLPIREVEREEVLLVHSEALWDKVLAIRDMTEQDIIESELYYEELSLYVHPSTPLAARLSCGGVIEACLAVARGEVRRSLAIVRPPGHHAEPDEHMGFCFFNNVAVAARVVQQLTPAKKILILDWDVHHGNGTQRAFNDDPTVLYISIHRYEGGKFYPNGPFGGLDSCGEGKGLGYSVNIPWPEKGMGDADYIHAFQQIVMPIGIEFAPDLVIVSAGFDAADGDDLGECHVTPAGYAHMTHMLSSLAGGNIVIALEGGYNLKAISDSCLAVTKVLLGESPPAMGPLVASQISTETIYEVALEQSKYWRNISPKSCVPREEFAKLTFTIPELLKAHRQEYLYNEHKMLVVPFATPELEARFGSQVACTPDIMENQTLIVFVHEFGNVRAELDSVTTCDLNMEHSYMVDFSKELLSWIRKTKHALLDVNVYAKQTTGRNSRGSVEIMTYLWDNYIQLTDARRIVLIGHGPGCQALEDLLDNRIVGVRKSVKAVVQVVGNFNIPMVPREARDWYLDHSCVLVPENHKAFTEDKTVKRHGLVMRVQETKPIQLMIKSFPAICAFIERMLGEGAKARA